VIIGVKKYLFIGVNEDKVSFFRQMQKKGLVEFLSKRERSGADLPKDLQKVMAAIKILIKQAPQRGEVPVKEINLDDLASTIVEVKSKLDRLIEEKDYIKSEIAQIEPLGEFSLSETDEIERRSNRHIQFFSITEAKLKATPTPEGLFYLNRKNDIYYFMSFSPDIRSFHGMVEIEVKHSLCDLRYRLEEVTRSIQAHEKELKDNRAYITLLEQGLASKLNRYNLECASEEVSNPLDQALFAVEGWIPENHLHKLFPIVEGLRVHAEEIAVEKGEHVPTYMENKSYGKIGEDLVHIYDTPAPQDKDPSNWVLWAFALFFAMIVSDAGYGLIFLGGSLFLMKKFPHARAYVKRTFRLFTILSLSCIAWGILANTYFGIDLAPKNPLNKISVIHYLAVHKADYHIARRDATHKRLLQKYPHLEGVESGAEFLQRAIEHKGGGIHYAVLSDFRDSIFMEIALLVGVLHISLSLLRYLRRHWGGSGWILTIIGGYLFFPKILDSTSVIHFMYFVPRQMGCDVGFLLMCTGIPLSVLLALIQKGWGGCIEITKVIELFADILSYLRIYALGLAAMILASTFNEMGISLGFVLGFFVILIGHIINLVIGIMGGTIHGLRLNFIEWYHHSFDGGGRSFQPLELLNIKGE